MTRLCSPKVTHRLVHWDVDSCPWASSMGVDRLYAADAAPVYLVTCPPSAGMMMLDIILPNGKTRSWCGSLQESAKGSILVSAEGSFSADFSITSPPASSHDCPALFQSPLNPAGS